MTDLRFGRFEVDLRARELRKDGIRLRLQAQPFEVLAMLLEHPGEVLTRDELRTRLWSDGTFVDFEHGLNAAVKRLRAALGDDPDRPRFVETLPRRGYRFIGRVERVNGRITHTSIAGQAPDTRLRLAVLPFVYLAEAGSRDYFSDGLTEELITQLGRLFADRLAVVARASSMLAERHGRSVRQIGETLRADYLVEGTVRREGDRVRIAVQLVDVHAETQLWAQSFDRQLADCLLVQSDVAAETVQSLAMELLPDRRSARANGTRRADAYQAYLKARYHWNKAGDEGLLPAIGYYEQALSIDPRFGAAYAGSARAHVAAAEYYLAEPRTALLAARAAAERALELDAADSEAYLTMAEVRRGLDWDWTGAEDEYRRALGFNPSNEAAHRLYGLFLAAHGRDAEAIAAADRARDLDPLCLVVNTGAAWVRYATGQYEEAVAYCRHTIDMDDQFMPARRLLAAASLQLGQTDQSVGQLEAVLRLREDPTTLACLAHALAAGGYRDRAAAAVGRLDELSRERYVSSYHRALARAAIGQADAAFALLERACTERDMSVMNLGVDRRFDGIRSDARYLSLLGRIGIGSVSRGQGFSPSIRSKVLGSR